MNRIKVLIVDDSRTYRNAIRSVLSDQPDIEVVGEGEDGIEAIVKAGQLVPNIILMDVAMPRMSGIEATTRVKQDFPMMTVIGLSVHESEEYCNSMMEAGASAYVLKETPISELLATMRNAR